MFKSLTSNWRLRSVELRFRCNIYGSYRKCRKQKTYGQLSPLDATFTKSGGPPLKLLLSTVNFFSRYTQATGILRRLARWMGKPDHMTHIDAGKTAPGFSLKPLDNKEYSLNTLLERGPVIASFFKSSCPVCQFTFPFLERLYKRYGGDGVTFLGISQDDARATQNFAKEYGVTFPLLLDESGYPVSNAYGLTNVPAIFLIDTGGTVKVSSMGFDKKDLETIAAHLAERKKISLAPLFRPDEVVPSNKPG